MIIIFRIQIMDFSKIILLGSCRVSFVWSLMYMYTCICECGRGKHLVATTKTNLFLFLFFFMNIPSLSGNFFWIHTWHIANCNHNQNDRENHIQLKLLHIHVFNSNIFHWPMTVENRYYIPYCFSNGMKLA